MSSITSRLRATKGDVEAYRSSLIAKCNTVRAPAGPPPSFDPASRIKSNEQGSGGNERWVPGTPPVLLKNAKIWTGARNGTEVVFGDVLLDQGLVIAVGYIPPTILASHRGANLKVMDVEGKWVTPGLVDLHSHIGVSSAPGLRGAFSDLYFLHFIFIYAHIFML